MSVHDGAGTPGSYSLEYTINEIEKVESGWLRVTAPGVGILENKIPFTPSAEGTITFDIDPSRVETNLLVLLLKNFSHSLDSCNVVGSAVDVDYLLEKLD